MSQFLLPTDDVFVEAIARAIAKDRIHRDANNAMQQMIGIPLDSSSVLEDAFDRVFEQLWNGTSEHDTKQKNEFRKDARAAISAINLRLLTTSP